jgi:hypothetical protein
MEYLNKLQLLKTKIKQYRAKHVKTKEFTFMGWVHNGIQVLAAGMGANICAEHVVDLQQKTFLFSPSILNNVWYWYFSFGFLASLIISFFGLWDIYNYGNVLLNKLHSPMECDGNY